MTAIFDGPNRIITLGAPTAGVLQQTAEQLYDDAKQWFLNANNRKYPFPFRTSGGEQLTPGINSGSYYQLQNVIWRIRPFEAHHTIYFDGNMTPQDATRDIMEPTVGAFTVGLFGLQPITQSVSALLTSIQNQGYTDGRVFVHTTIGTPGGTGVTTDPVDTLTAADVIIAAKNLPKGVRQNGLITLTTEDVSNYNFLGGAATRDTLDLGSGSTQDKAIFTNLKLQGTVNGTIHAKDCILDNVSDFDGFLVGGAVGGTLSLGGETHLVNTHAAASGQNSITLDYQGNSLPAFIPGWEGHMKIINHSHAGALTVIDMRSGTIELDSSVTAGVIVVRGQGRLINNGSIVPINQLVDPAITTRLGLNKQDPVTDTAAGIDSVSGEVDIDRTGDGVTTSTLTRQ